MKYATTAAILTCAAIAFSSCTQHHHYGKEEKKAASPIVKSEQQEKIDTVIKLRDQGVFTDAEAKAKIDQILGLNKPVPTSPAPAPVKAVAAAPSAPVANSNMDLNLAVYKPAQMLSGKLISIGSDSMDRMMEMWEKKFRGHHPSLDFSHEGKGSSTATPALIEGRSNVGPMSRAFKSSEIAKFENQFGYKPVQVRVAVDSLAIYIHPSNPLAKSGLTLAQADTIFSADRLRGGKQVKTWGDLGLSGEWANKPIKVYSRNTASGTFGFFKKKLCLKGNFKESNIQLESSEEVVQAVAKDKFAVGFSGIAFNSPSVATLPLAEQKGAEFVAPNEISALSGSYPITRSLYVSYNLKPSGIDNLQKEFIKFVYSRTGQSIVRKDGYFPVNAMVAKQELSKLQL